MGAIVLGLAALALLLFGGEAFSRARIATIKALLSWVAALAGLSLLALLMLSGKGEVAFAALPFLVPLGWNWWQERRRASPAGAKRPAGVPGRMSRAEALEILGLRDGCSAADIRAAWLRVVQGAHPDRGGSDWLAAKVNEARDTLLRR